MNKYRVSYDIIGPWTSGWRDVDGDRGVTVQRGDRLQSCKVRDLQPGDLARGVNHSRIVTGAPVRVLKVRQLED